MPKAKLFALDGSQYDVEFLFNPTEISFSRSVNVKDDGAARTQQGTPKVSFAKPNPCQVTVNNVIFDTYEKNASVMPYLDKLVQAVKFIDSGERPPIFMFIWGNQDYLRCFVQQVTYNITLFLKDGTPVRAKVNLTLKEVDTTTGPANPRTPSQVDRFGDSRESRG